MNEEKKPIIDLSEEGMSKSSNLVSNIVTQLIDQGYTGDILSNSSLGASKISVDTKNEELQDELNNNEDEIIEDIDFDKKKKKKKENQKTPEQKLEERKINSQQQIDKVNKDAKKLYSEIDSFIGSLREAANNAQDNYYLCKKLEGIRKICISFVRSTQAQMPKSPASLFVNLEDNIDG